jgi:hypothetical protein
MSLRSRVSMSEVYMIDEQAYRRWSTGVYTVCSTRSIYTTSALVLVEADIISPHRLLCMYMCTCICVCVCVYPRSKM